MTTLKALVFGSIITLGYSVCSYAGDEPIITEEAIAAAAEIEISREMAIQISTDLANCAGLFQASIRYEQGASKPRDVTPSKALVKKFHTAAILIWSKHGTNFLQIKSLKDRRAEVLAPTFNAAFGYADANANAILKDSMSKCKDLAELAGAVSNYARDPAETQWR